MRHHRSLPALLALAACQVPAPAPLEAATERSATLGITTGVPPAELARRLGLEFDVRQQGRLVQSLVADGPAARAGIEVEDVLLELDGVTLYSQDDVADILSVHAPDEVLSASVVRNATSEREEIELTLGTGAARSAHELRWQYASLAQLPAALERARAEKKKVLVGLSGAET